MPEVPNAYQCDYCHKIMTPIETKDARWHSKFCSLCGFRFYDVFIGQTPVNTDTY
jgi:hypothetical protein